MLFNSYEFIFAYLPITLLVFFLLGRRSHRLAISWLTAASLFFYAWWNPVYVLLLMASIVFNYVIGMGLARLHDQTKTQYKNRLLFFGIAANLSLLAYYKYAHFFIVSLNDMVNGDYAVPQIILPIGISFFTFTQLAFLIDAARGLAREYNFTHYGLFVSYFPHLIAGPVLHHKEMMPQFAKAETCKLNHDQFALGISFFLLGLFKKIVLADNISVYASPVFEAAARGEVITLLEAWGGALSYTLQLYFDFSGYSDMAIGLSWMFGVKLPINFNSPYKALNIIEFWRRWHMSLSGFLREYLYIPLGGNRKGRFRRHANLLITMLLGGLWHGANWTYLAWGGLHGIYLIINHGWQGLRASLGFDKPCRAYCFFSGLITFIAVVVAWVFFRSNSLTAGIALIKAMLGVNGISLPMKWVDDSDKNPVMVWLLAHGVKPSDNYALFEGGAELRMIGLLLLICWFFPNTQQVFDGAASGGVWRPSKRWAVVVIGAGFFAVLSLSELSEFIYFQF